MNKDKLKSIYQIVMPTLAAVAFAVAVITAVGTITFHALPKAFGAPVTLPWLPWVIATILLLVATVAGLWSLAILDPIESKGDVRAVSNAMFTRYLIGLGYFLFVDAVVNMVAFAGIAHSGRLGQIFPLGDGALSGEAPKSSATSLFQILSEMLAWMHHPDDSLVLTVILVLSLGMALLGALFFFANALWVKFKKQEVLFDPNVFWGGLWFRVAEAIVFTIAVFLFLQFQGYNKAIRYLPMMGLFIGMTVKSSEALIFGIAERLLASVSALVQGPKAPPPPAPLPPPPPPLAPNK